MRAALTATAGTATAAAVSALIAPQWTVVAVAAGLLGTTGYAVRHRARVALEVRMVRALVRSVPRCPGDVEMSGLDTEVRAEVSADGVTRIEAGSWLDAVRALGYVMGRDRAFHLELMRRTANGRLAEVWGAAALPVDEQYRPLGLARTACHAAKSIEVPERDLLTAFASGVNTALDRHGPSFESRFLAFQPEPWTVADSLLVALLLFHSLSWNEQAKRAEAVIRRALPAEVADFFLPGDAALPEGLARFRASGGAVADIVGIDRTVAGSNCWIKGGAGGPVLACDLHLPLAMPNVLYEVDLRWPGRRLRGLAAPGLPVVLSGTNGDIVWGITNLSADVLDLVPVDADDVVTDVEHVGVRGGRRASLAVARAGTMPVSPAPLLDRRVAVRWTGHDSRGCDLKFQRLAQAVTVGESLALLEDADGAALNVLVADRAGRTAHVATGLLPRRPAGSPGAPHGYLTGAQRPRLVDPPSGILVSANDAALAETPFRIGYDPDPGYRARRVRHVLTAADGNSPATMRALQHDTAAELYTPYRDLAAAALSAHGHGLAALLTAWDGHAAVGSRAFAILVRLREILAQRVIAPYLAACRDHDPAFRYPFRSIDRPLLAMLTSGEPSLLPDDDVSRFLVRCVDQAVAELTAPSRRRRLPRWGELNSVGLRHPLAKLAPWADALLGVAARPQAGALHSVRTCVPRFGAAGRAVLAPGPAGYAAFDLPGGQSGHPLSRHFDDRHDGWASTVPRAGGRRHGGCVFTLHPTGGADR